jgi:hypothetical protein
VDNCQLLESRVTLTVIWDEEQTEPMDEKRPRKKFSKCALTFLATTSRWSSNPERLYTEGRVWYGIMCRSFVLA